MKRQARAITLIAVSSAVIIGSTASGEARIKCRGAYQISAGTLIATPYCGDRYLARVAREYGMRVSARTIRRDIATKDDACRLVGHDNRVSDICTGFRNEVDNDSDSGDSPR